MHEKIETAVFGGGCFWCTEAVFNMLKGVVSVEPGYSGGHKENPGYEEVSGGETGHAECVKIDFDPSQISYETLLTIFFASHDPTSLNRQGGDIGTQYRSVIFYSDLGQKAKAEEFIKNLNSSSKEGRDIVTELAPLEKFYPAENYHKNYFAENPDNPYCQVVINPKLEKVQKQFADILKSLK